MFPDFYLLDPDPDPGGIFLCGSVRILKGGVKIEKNLTLCYVKTINWRNIVVDTIHQEHRGEPQGTDVSFFMSTVDTVLGNRHCGKSF